MPLTVAVRLRHGRYDAAGTRPSVAEWPPHPARVFCALTASAESAEDWAALRWLETIEPPEVWAPSRAARGRTASYVVANVRQARGKSQFWPGRSADMRSRAFAVPDADTFAVVWPNAEPDSAILERLHVLAGRVPYVGRSTSQAEVTVQADLPTEQPGLRFGPSRFGVPGMTELRVPYPGYTDELRETFMEGGHAWEVARSVPYAPVSEPATESPAPALAPFGDLLVWGFEEPTARIDGGRVMQLTSMLRKAVIDRVPDPVPSQVNGHGADGRAHLAYLAIPDVGHRHADGHLIGLALAVPRDMPADDWKRLVQGVVVSPLTRLTVWRTEPLRLAYGGERPGRRRARRPERRGLRPERWTAQDIGGSRTWTTATAIMPDGWLRKGRSMADLVRRSLLYAGYPEPAEIETSPAPLTTGAARRPRAGTLPDGRPPRKMTHARVTFAEPVIGPVIAGTTRYLGLGLFLPDEHHHE